MRDAIVQALIAQLEDQETWKPLPVQLELTKIRVDEARGLEAQYTEAEVHEALLVMNGDKAPGSDGYCITFWIFNLDIVKEELMGMFREFHETGRFVMALNSTFRCFFDR